MRIMSIFPVLCGLIGGALGSQLPEFSQQYRQRLGGALGEIDRIVTEFDRTATGSGLSRDEALAQYATANNEFLIAQGKRRRASGKGLRSPGLPEARQKLGARFRARGRGAAI